jgi:hypothetical protein
MDATDELSLQPSPASSHFPPEPISGSTLFEMEILRGDGQRGKGTLGTGCREVDEQALVHGFDRGSVVGVSVEEVEMGLLVSLLAYGWQCVMAERRASGFARPGIASDGTDFVPFSDRTADYSP